MDSTQLVLYVIAVTFITIATIANWSDLEPIQRVLYPLWLLGMCLPTLF